MAWFYRPEEAAGGRKAFHSVRELFRSDHRDWVVAASILGRCRVLDLRAYQALPAASETDFFYRFSYRAATSRFTPRRVPVFCVCEMPYNPDLLMLECVDCAEWYHPECVGMERGDVGGATPRVFVCPECVAAQQADAATAAAAQAAQAAQQEQEQAQQQAQQQQQQQQPAAAEAASSGGDARLEPHAAPHAAAAVGDDDEAMPQAAHAGDAS